MPQPVILDKLPDEYPFSGYFPGSLSVYSRGTYPDFA